MNMKKFIAGVMACCIVGGAMPNVIDVVSDIAITASAEDEAEYTEGTYKQLTYKKYSDYIEISGCDKEATEVVIPAEIEGLPVTSIGYGAFMDCSGLTSVTIPESVTSIGIYAFYGSGLTSVTIPDSVTIIKDYAFSVCESLTSVTIPDSVTIIKDYAFSYCKGLTSVTIPESVTSIGNSTFSNCKGLTSVTIPESVTSLGGRVFENCTGLTSIEIPESVTSIGLSAFSGTPWLESKQKENPLVVVNGILIDGTTCSGDVIIPDGVTSIEGSAFNGCAGLTSITIPDSVTSIGINAFSNCADLKSIKILNPECKIYDYSTTITNSRQVIPGENGGKGKEVYTFDGTIYGYENSTAQEYAEKYNRNFESIGKAPETTTSPVVTTTAKPTTTTATTTKPTATTGGNNPDVTVLGDSNGDGNVNMADATAIVQHIGNKDAYGLSAQGLANADTTGDGQVTGADVLAIQMLVAKQIDKLPYIE